MFSAWGRQASSKAPKNCFLTDSLKLIQNSMIYGFNGILGYFGDFLHSGVPWSRNTNFALWKPTFREVSWLSKRHEFQEFTRISMGITWNQGIQEFLWNLAFSGKLVPCRRRVKTAVIPMLFIGSGARFRAPTPKNSDYLVFSLNSPKFT